MIGFYVGYGKKGFNSYKSSLSRTLAWRVSLKMVTEVLKKQL